MVRRSYCKARCGPSAARREQGGVARLASDASPGISGADAGVVELVDAPDSKSGSARSVGSIPTARTRGYLILCCLNSVRGEVPANGR